MMNDAGNAGNFVRFGNLFSGTKQCLVCERCLFSGTKQPEKSASTRKDSFFRGKNNFVQYIYYIFNLLREYIYDLKRLWEKATFPNILYCM